MKASGILHIVLDISGSMQEMGKLLLARNLVSFIREFSDFHPKKFSFTGIRLFTWNEAIQPVELTDNCATPHFKATGKADLARLKEFLESETEKTTQIRGIILSDGNCPDKALLKNFSAWCKEHPHLTLCTVAIGADSSHSGLKKLSTNNRVFSSEDISAAIQSLTAGIKGKVRCPTSVNEFSPPSDKEHEEVWE